MFLPATNRPQTHASPPATHHGNTACCVTHFLQRRPSINWSKPIFQPNLPSFISYPSILHRWAVPQLCLPASCLNLFSIQARETRHPVPGLGWYQAPSHRDGRGCLQSILMSWCTKTTQPLLLQGFIHWFWFERPMSPYTNWQVTVFTHTTQPP